MQTFDQLIAQALERRASDLHLSAAIPPTIRVDGELVPLGDTRCTPDDVRFVAEGIMDDQHKATLEELGEVDFAYSAPKVGRFRINVYRQRGTWSMAARILNLRIPSPQELGIPDSVVSMCDKKRGLVLVTGATGSGKSTTLACMIDRINHRREGHIITMEDPIEYIHRHGKSIVTQREIGSDSPSYLAALRSALRESPDIILLGEMRDRETIEVAMTAAETGQLLFSTLHTTGAASTVDRIVDVFPASQQNQVRIQLSMVLQAVISQQLVPTVDGGQTVAFEVMYSNTAIRTLIREAKSHQIDAAIQAGAAEGMCTMDASLLRLVQQQRITKETALTYSIHYEAMEKRLAALAAL